MKKLLILLPILIGCTKETKIRISNKTNATLEVSNIYNHVPTTLKPNEYTTMYIDADFLKLLIRNEDTAYLEELKLNEGFNAFIIDWN